jgi:serine protease Do
VPQTQAIAALPTEGLELAERLERHFQTLVERVAPSIVTVTAYARTAAGAPPEPASEGGWIVRTSTEYPSLRVIGAASGVVVSSAGDILTTRDALLKPDGTPADLVDVETHDNQHTISAIAGMEPTLNFAVVRMQLPSPDNAPRFQPIVFGDSSRARPGQWAIAVADPYGPAKYFAVGSIAGDPNRDCYQEQLSATYLQLGLGVPAEARGGALVDARGTLMGLLVTRTPVADSFDLPPPSEFGYALPSNILQGIYGTIQRNQTFQSPWLGIAVMTLPELRRELGADAFEKLDRPRQGIYIENVYAPSPTHGAGIAVGDFLTKIGDVWIGSVFDFQRQLYITGIGGKASFEFYRNGETFERELTVEVRPPEAQPR